MSSLGSQCTPATFGFSLCGIDIISIQASIVSNYTVSIPDAARFADHPVELQNAEFCNVTVAYTHPQEDDTINVEAWLPTKNWNTRLEAIGGSGWAAGRVDVSYFMMAGALADGFATLSTDAGIKDPIGPASWALKGPDEVDWNALTNFAHLALKEQAIIGKSVIRSFYKEDPTYSYFAGCSQGGRQGFMLAQRYPEAYDGIISGAPVINWNQLLFTLQWPQQVMNELGEFPLPCELDGINEAAVAACDELDEAVDGIISDPQKCLKAFDPFSMVGKTVACAQTNGSAKTITLAAAKVTNASWHGPITMHGKPIWYGFAPGTDLSGTSKTFNPTIGSAMTQCNDSGCTGIPVIGHEWVRYFVLKDDPLRPVTNLSQSEYINLFYQSIEEYDAVIGTSNIDLSKFHEAGGKIISVHGTMDQLVPEMGTVDYFNKVVHNDPTARDFFRHYSVPGLGHCTGGKSGQPQQLFQQLRDWVEKDIVPNESPVKVTTSGGVEEHRVVCPHPAEAQLKNSCKNASSAECWTCEGHQ